MSALYPDLINTFFPDSLDIIPLFSDITTAEEANWIQNIQDLIKMGNMDQATKILQDHPELYNKIFNAHKFNSFRDAILALERFYKTDIKPYIITKQTEWTNTMNNFSYIAYYNPVTQYQKNNIISYNSGEGEMLYICINKPPTGTSPANLAFWRQFTIRGKQGISGGSFAFKFDWKTDVQYYEKDSVAHNGTIWGALEENINSEPEYGNSNWYSLIPAPSPKQYPVQPTQPLGMATGDLWFKLGRVVN